MEAMVQVEPALAAVRALVARANSLVSDEFDYMQEHHERPEYSCRKELAEVIDTAFLQLLNLSESLGLSKLCDIVASSHANAREIGLAKWESFEDLSAWSHWSGPIARLADSIAAVYGLQQRSQGTVSTDLLTLLEATQAAITDKRCFSPPKDESEVHDRIEVILRCVYRDLLRKPPLAKPVVHFVPDTGIKSIDTLIEYKFLSDAAQAGQIANEILADTRGYAESGWGRIVFVIYETKRFKTIDEWRHLLRASDVPDTVAVVLLYGEQPDPAPVAKRARSRPRVTPKRG